MIYTILALGTGLFIYFFLDWRKRKRLREMDSQTWREHSRKEGLRRWGPPPRSTVAPAAPATTYSNPTYTDPSPSYLFMDTPSSYEDPPCHDHHSSHHDTSSYCHDTSSSFDAGGGDFGGGGSSGDW